MLPQASSLRFLFYICLKSNRVLISKALAINKIGGQAPPVS